MKNSALTFALAALLTTGTAFAQTAGITGEGEKGAATAASVNPAGKKIAKADRVAARKQRRSEMAAANKAGELKVYGETRVPANAK